MEEEFLTRLINQEDDLDDDAWKDEEEEEEDEDIEVEEEEEDDQADDLETGEE